MALFTEAQLVPLSALQHLLFCERQFALIHVERQWVENRLTAEGRLLHEKVDSGGHESRGHVRAVRAIALRSLKLGLSGRADVVEFHRCHASAEGVRLPGISHFWKPLPVEHKRGRPKRNPCDRVQLCAQAICLEEMLDVVVDEGALYYGTTRRRTPVMFDEALRHETERTAERVHAILAAGTTPPATREPKCDSCSFLDICVPAAGRRSARRYMDGVLKGAEEDGSP